MLTSALPEHPLPLVGKKVPAAGGTGVTWGHDYDEKRWNILKALDASDPAKAKTYPAVTTTHPHVKSCSRGCYCQKGCCWWHIPPKWLVVRTIGFPLAHFPIGSSMRNTIRTSVLRHAACRLLLLFYYFGMLIDAYPMDLLWASSFHPLCFGYRTGGRITTPRFGSVSFATRSRGCYHSAYRPLATAAMWFAVVV